ncbi:SERTA domain-containing protein 1 [Rhinatrema bivittatum]|uniref:SERTA domain-containing protein 1 n=1 Tax=Rhinatrema bivittatum TaxID=194408 RepID=UPI00112614A8|nr:SERTA domain-containing protein 1 [Rhinatrema bivittatum]XP_029426964.1 SERTA domain-containing protein 1 [Rhinatrema bivittatum]XP_029426965.1 SERTA domain-containing protein 1 [Rhinatrema bivittatum]XP_029426966.1 SERTA domain-containing protein 1 [Rhinatrema bivittatum]
MLAKGIKRKYGELSGRMDFPPDALGVCRDPVAAVPSPSLLNLSLLKLHRSLGHVEPNLRHLVLVANTLRRLQDDVRVEQNGQGPSWRAASSPAPLGTSPREDSDVCRRQIQGDDLLLSSCDTSWYASVSTMLEDLNQVEGLSSDPHPIPLADDPTDSLRVGGGCLEEAKEGPVPPAPASPAPLDILSSSSYLLEDSFQDIFEDIDTSMYDCEPWSPTSLVNFKAFSNAEDSEVKSLTSGQNGKLELTELDYLMDVLVGTQAC